MTRMLLAAAAAVVLALPAGAQNWKPTKPVNIIVPWAAGGSTDQVIRVVAGELEDALGQKFVVVNQPGASGSIGTKSVLEAPKDGYTWASGAAGDVGSYRVTGLLDTGMADWHFYLAIANVSVVGVGAATPYKDFKEFVDLLKARGDGIPVATAGISSAAHNAMELLVKLNPGMKYKHVTYDGGNPAVIAVASGEAHATAQLASEQAEMIRAKRVRPLAVLAGKPLTLDGYGDIPPVTNWLPNFVSAANYFGMWAHKDTPKEVIETMNQVWSSKIANSAKLRAYATARGAAFDPSSGAEAHKRGFAMVQEISWNYFDAGKAKLDPSTVGIPRPAK
ncbi:MAG: tripartite tricarboxylate transporter substrate binding protein [Alphaproteobacteria bacterium]|nr:tripartite tricarboxylate transporter substrate binding protein [Alphaproteobacteria bacterium]